MPSLRAFGEAIRQKEGWFEGSRSWRNNNPGNLRSWGSYPIDGGYAKFPDYATGWRALISQIKKNVNERHLTMFEFFGGKTGVYYGYAPAKDGNDPVGYAQFVAGKVGVNPAIPLSSYQWVDDSESHLAGTGGGTPSGATGGAASPSGGTTPPPTPPSTPDGLLSQLEAAVLGTVDLPYLGSVPAWYLLAGVGVFALLLRR